VAVFGSFHGGYRVLRTLVDDFADTVELVGVATDDLSQPYTHAAVRLWKYPHTRAEELMVPLYAESLGLEPFTGRVKSDEFHRLFIQDWRPDLCLMATFGQLIPKSIFTVPRLGFYNFHHSDLIPHPVLCRMAGERP
jgi:methionyl-tRNA formyltransferase